MLLSLYRSCLWYVLERQTFYCHLRDLLVLNVNRMSWCQCDAIAHIKVSEERENSWIGYCRFAHNLIWVKWMDWLPVRFISKTPAFLTILKFHLPVHAASPISVLFSFRNEMHTFLFVCFVWFGFSERFLANTKWGGKKNKFTEEIDPQTVPAKDLYLFCTCIVFRDVFNYFGCWNKACLCGQLDGYVTFLPLPQCLSLSRN